LRVTFSQRVYLTMAFVAFAGVIFYLTFDLGRVARMVPFAVVVPTLLLLLVQLMLDMLPRLSQAYSRLENKDLFSVEGLRKKISQSVEAVEDQTLERYKEREAFLWLLALLLLIYLLGFLVALPLYTLLYLKKRTEKWLMAVSMAAGIAGLVYGVSILDLGTDLYGGLLWRWLKL
jgi:hypothetical protein